MFSNQLLWVFSSRGFTLYNIPALWSSHPWSILGFTEPFPQLSLIPILLLGWFFISLSLGTPPIYFPPVKHKPSYSSHSSVITLYFPFGSRGLFTSPFSQFDFFLWLSLPLDFHLSLLIISSLTSVYHLSPPPPRLTLSSPLVYLRSPSAVPHFNLDTSSLHLERAE